MDDRSMEGASQPRGEDELRPPRSGKWVAHRPSSAEEITREVIAAHLEVEPSTIKPHQHLERDLGITLLGLVLIGLDLEDVEHVSLSFEDFSGVQTVADLSHRLEVAMRGSDAAHHLHARP
jgi:acyl carrier protein